MVGSFCLSKGRVSVVRFISDEWVSKGKLTVSQEALDLARACSSGIGLLDGPPLTFPAALLSSF